MISNIDVILFEAKYPENVGFVARSMLAFGFQNLILINPQYSHDNRQAYKTSSGASGILENAMIVSSLQEASAESHQIIGFSRRQHNTPTPHTDLNEWIKECKTKSDIPNTSLLFGPEHYGLSRELVTLCSKVVEIPLHHQSLSLNLSHAATIVLYELYKSLQLNNHSKKSVKKSTPINQNQLYQLFDAIRNLKFDKSSTNQGKQNRQEDILLNFLQHSHINEDEFSVLMGYFKKKHK